MQQTEEVVRPGLHAPTWGSLPDTAEVVAAPTSTDQVHFGSTVTFHREDGRVQTYRIVGEDEADPKSGSMSHVSPVAIALLGKSVGDVVVVAGQELEVIKIA